MQAFHLLILYSKLHQSRFQHLQLRYDGPRQTFVYDGRYAWSQSHAYQVCHMYMMDFAYDEPISWSH